MAGSGRAQENKGRLKEAAGALRGDEDQENEGRVDQAGGTLTQAGETARDALDDVTNAIRR